MGTFHDALKAAGVEYAALSWGGFDLYGDHKSIQEARRFLHEAGTVPALRERLLEASRLSNDWMIKHDRLLKFIQDRPAILKELIEIERGND